MLAGRACDEILQIIVPAPNHLVYEFMDGTRVERVWQDKSRDLAWTEEMRRQAAEYTRKRWAK